MSEQADSFKLNGVDFDSKWAMERYAELLLMEREGQIEGLQVHAAFGLHALNPCGHRSRVGECEWQFVYWRGQRMFAEDARPRQVRETPLNIWKAKHFEAQYGVHVSPVDRNRPRSGHRV